LSIIPSRAGRGEDLIGQAVLSSIYRANHRIVISTPLNFRASEAIFFRSIMPSDGAEVLKVTLLLPNTMIQ